MKYFKYILCIMVIFYCTAKAQEDAPLKITVLGTGYVGLITGACFAEFGHIVRCVDTQSSKIEMLNNNIMPIYEPGLDQLVLKNVTAERLSFSTDIAGAIEWADCIFIAVGTPAHIDGCADLSAVYKAFDMIISHLNSYKIICMKSTVPIGTCQSLCKLLDDKGVSQELYDIVSNPEFLREGSAIFDFMNPDRLVFGVTSVQAQKLMERLYKPLFDQNVPALFTHLASSETIKYASNAFLATKLSFINEIANLCDKTGADIADVAKGLGLDKRVGSAFLKPGPGFGGSCFPKDCHALCKIGQIHSSPLFIVEAALQVNELQKQKPFEKLQNLLPDLSGKTIGVLGLAFKNNTDDIRYSPAITLIELLLAQGVIIKAYDPAAMKEMAKLFPEIHYCASLYEAATDVDAIVIMTEWDQFRTIDLADLRKVMKGNIIIDARNLLDPIQLKQNEFIYAQIGRN